MSNTNSILRASLPTILGGVIAQKRESKGLNQGQMAQHMGLGQSTWGRIEKGSSGLSVEQLLKAAEVLGTDASSLLREAEKVAENLRLQNIQVENQRIDKSGSDAGKILGAAALAGLILLAMRK